MLNYALKKQLIKGKSVERQGRKAMGLKLWKHNHGRQATEESVIMFNLRGPGLNPGPFFLNFYKDRTDNRKPVERRGRKAMGLPLWKHNQDCQASENKPS